MSARLLRTERRELRPILLVDDDDSIRELLLEVLDLEGAHRVVTAANGREALDFLMSREELPCVVVTDLMMPGMSGWELLDAMKAEPVLSAIPAIVVSASLIHGFDSCERRVTHARFLSKPIRPDDLVQMIASLCTCAKASGFRARASQIA